MEPAPPRVTVFGYWWRVVRFALLGRPPRVPADVPVWALCVTFRQWNRPKRYNGETFGQSYTRRAGPIRRLLVPYRLLYLVFLFLWPLAALGIAARHAPHTRTWWRHALFRPDEAMVHPDARHTPCEIAWMRPDYALAMYYAWEFVRTRQDYHWLDDKQRFVEMCRDAGLPIPPTLTAAEAARRGGSFIVKDPHRDLGRGVELLDAAEIAELEDADTYVIQERLYNHPALLAAFPADAALSTLRVFTTLDADTGEPVVTRTAIRISRAGSIADNTAQGGIWSQVDPTTGAIRAGVTKKTFGTWDGDRPVRHGTHPDTGRSFDGLVVPWFEEGKRLALEAHRRIAPKAPSLGWDVALARDAPVLLEVNVWTVCYDYDPPSDAFTPAARLIIERVRRLRAGEGV